jgi:hypothetical protein
VIKATITEIIIHRDEDPDLTQDTTTVKLVDEGGGRFITLTQYNDNYNEITLRLDPTEIPLLVETINKLLNQ